MYYNFRIKSKNKTTQHSFPLCFLLCPNIPKTFAMMNVMAEVRMKVGRLGGGRGEGDGISGWCNLGEDVKVVSEGVKSSLKVLSPL